MKTCLLAVLALVSGLGTAQAQLAGPAQLLGPWHATEGPSWDPAGYLYYVSHDRISRWDLRHPPETFRLGAGRPGSSLVDPQRRLLVCESGARRITRIERDGSTTVLADRFEGKRFNSPNDLALDSHGRIYFTDPRYGSRAGVEMLSPSGRLIEGVYRIDAPGRVTRIINGEVEKPNGILVSPDDRYLYIADDNVDTVGGARKIWRFDLRSDGSIDPRSRWLLFDWGTDRGPDGFKMDRAGRFYVAAGVDRPIPPAQTSLKYKSGIYVISPEGKLLQFVAVGTTVQNCAFGGPDLRTLYVTAAGTLWSIPASTPGVISAQPLSP
jgi:gluconolactonase